MSTDLSCDVLIHVYDISFMKMTEFPHKHNLDHLLDVSKCAIVLITLNVNLIKVYAKI